MRIAMVSEHASPLAALGGVDAGGQNVHVAALATELARRGHEVLVYTRREDEVTPERVGLAPGATVVQVPAGPATVLPKDELLRHMDDFGDRMAEDWRRSGRPDVVHAHFWMSGLAALRARRAVPVPVVQTFHALGTVKRRHQGAADPSPPDRIELESQLVRSVDRVIATCNDEVTELAAMGGPLDHVRVVPCGVDTAAFHPGEPGDGPFHAAPGSGRLLVVGRMVPRKGFDTVIEALAVLRENWPDAELVIAGGPPAADLAADDEAQRLLDIARSCGVAEAVRLVGRLPHEQMPGLYRACDVVLAAPWYEPFGITPLEAAACGRPLVGSAVGGLLDSVVDGETGRLVPPRDPATLASAVAEVLADPGRAARWGAQARHRALERFDWTVVAAATEQVLEDVVRGEPARPHLVMEAPGTDRGDELLGRSWLDKHQQELRDGLAEVERCWPVIQAWGRQLALTLDRGGRLLAAGNGGSAAEAQHLTSELVGRFLTERRPFSAISLHAETSSATAIVNDYGPEELFARQVEGHGRPGDLLVLLSTSGTSSNVLHAAKRAHEVGLTVWALTGPAPNPLASLADAAITVPAGSTAAIQEVHLVVIHALCAAMDSVLASRSLLFAPDGRRNGDSSELREAG